MKFDHMTDSQKMVFEQARKKLEKKPWYSGVCCDNYPSDKECTENPSDAVASVIMETMMCDAPRGIFG